MLKNYLKIAIRNLVKDKGYSAINVIGLAAGMACCILICFYILDEISYDRFHQDYQRIFRVVSDEKNEGQVRRLANAYGPLAPALISDFPEIEQLSRLFPHSVTIESVDGKRFQEERFFFADSAVFELFTMVFQRGDVDALKRPYSLVLTESAARKYFGDADPIGRVLKIENRAQFHVSAVVADMPSNSHFHFDFLAPIDHVKEMMGWAPHWYWPPVYTYLRLPENYAPAALESRFPDLVGKHIGEWAKNERTFRLQPLRDIHLNPDFENEIEPTSNQAYIYIFAAIALFILLIACCNFMNLTTARAAKRAKEVGLRKTVGAKRSQLIKQFFGESLCYAALATVISLGLVELFLPAFNQLVGKNLRASYFAQPELFVALLALTILVGLISGSYPALFLSNFRPMAVLKSNWPSGPAGRSPLRLRALLVILQFTISITLICVTYFLQRQLNFVQTRRLGFEKERLIILPIRDQDVQNNFAAIKNRLLSQASVLGVTALSNYPWRTGFYDFPIKAEGLSADAQMSLPTLIVDHDFIRTFGMELAAGRDFSKDVTSDATEAFIVNEAAVKKLGWETAIGKEFESQHIAGGLSRKGRVIGVVKDFHLQSLRYAIEPMVMLNSPASYYLDNFAIRLDGRNLRQELADLEQTWRAVAPHRPFDYFFLDADFERLYHKEQNLSKIFRTFSVLATIVACLGLVGLASFSSEQRRKEIGIRKTFGASLGQIVLLFSRDFAKLTMFANIVAWPIAYFAMQEWLQDFAYRTDLAWWVFLLSGGLALVIALLSVSFQAVKAALANPVDSLRYE
ncbi:MAG TPA: FtsX-like permease family protein [bacterium]